MLKMKNLKIVLRIIFGLFLLFFGLNGLLQFAPMPEVGPEAGAFLGAISSTKIFFPLISIIEIATGALILLNKAVPLALVLIFPILLCAVLFHISLNPEGIVFALIGFILNGTLFFLFKGKYTPLLTDE
tara:strand:+ start:1018 stop:1404 length:387 start_codon:yes stop_codon:yes gene_type:complete